MADDLSLIEAQIVRRQDLLDGNIGIADMEEYNRLTLAVAQSARSLLRAIQDVIALRDDLLETPDTNPLQAVAVAFGGEIERALKGQR